MAETQKASNNPISKKETPKLFSIIAIGASAGGLEALKLFFDAVPHNFRHCFVIVQHLSPDHKSLMKELLEKNTPLPIHEVKHEMKVKPGNIYLIPPGKNMILENHMLLLSNKPDKKKLNLPINIFFNSLAKEEKEKAIAVLLSGTGSDGTIGAKEIHEYGGLIYAQNPEEAKFDGMPLSAINTGIVDYILSAAKIPAAIIDFLSEDGKSHIEREIEGNPKIMGKLLSHISNVTNFDFNSFKSPTLVRRIGKRISLGEFKSFSSYFNYLLDNQKEVYLLEKEFLISVTEFYRDKEVWETFKTKILHLVVGIKTKEESIKVWSVGCSTGQEPYTIADLIYEELLIQKKTNIQTKIFASDASADNINFASKGIYKKSAVKNLSIEQITRMFDEIDGQYQIKDHLRQMVVFSVHNILVDPPFGKMDLVTCRNLLIYMNKESQANIIGTLQYSLKLGGHLILGKSESIGAHQNFFQELDSKNRLFKNLKVSKSLFAQKISLEGTKYNPNYSPNTLTQSSSSFAKYELMEVLNKCLPQVLDLSFMLVDQNFSIIEAVGNFSKYLSLPQQGFSTDLFDLVPSHMRSPLNIGFNKAINTNDKIKIEALRLTEADEELVTDIIIFPQASLVDAPLDKFLLVFMPRAQKESDITVVKGLQGEIQNDHVSFLEKELKSARHSLIRLQHELEIRNEELQTSNEELLATNEELQSTNEELQSVNEELYTVNAELNHKVHDLAEANAHINNILKSSDVNTLFLDQDLNIRKFTPGILKHFNIAIDDIGRPLAAFSHNFGVIGDDLLENSKEVIRSGVAYQKEMQDKNQNWFLKRISPFYDAKNIISGVVVIFVNIDDLKNAEEAQRVSAEEYRSIFENAPDMFITITPDNTITNCNQKLVNGLGYDSKDALIGKKLSSLLTPQSKKESKKDLKKLENNQFIENEFREVIKKDGSLLPIHVNAKAVTNDNGNVLTVIGSWRDMTKVFETQKELEYKNISFEQTLENTMAGFWDWNIPNNTEYLSPSFKKMFGYEDHEMKNEPEAWQKIIHPDDLPKVFKKFNEHIASRGEIPFDNEVRYFHKNGEIVWVWCKGKVIEWENKTKPIRMVGSHINITELKKYQEELQQSNQQLERFAYVASHDLQEPLRTIVDFTELLKEEYTDELDNDAETYIDFIIQASNRMGALVKSILEYSKIGQKSVMETVNLNTITNNVLKDLHLRIKERGAKITIKELPMALGNPMELHSLFLNLIGNALKFVNEKNTPLIKITHTIKKGLLQINIEDNGIGIKKSNQDKIFEVFKKLHNQEDYEGTGIGLAYCKKIVQLHGGNLWVTSELGKGSTFHFTLKTKEC